MSSDEPSITPPTLDSIQLARRSLLNLVRETPSWQWTGQHIQELVPQDTTLWMKLELFQHAGSFKARGVMLAMQALDEAARKRGVTAVSAGNHAMAVAYGARAMGSHAKVVMPTNANPARVAASKALGAEV